MMQTTQKERKSIPNIFVKALEAVVQLRFETVPDVGRVMLNLIHRLRTH